MRLNAPLALLALCLTALHPTPAEAFRRPPDVIDDALAYATVDRSKAIVLLEDALADDPPKRQLHALMLHAGEQHRLAENLEGARRWFTQILEDDRRKADVQSARLGLALVEATRQVDSRIVAVLRDVPERHALDTQNADRFLVLAAYDARKNEPESVAIHTRKALDYAANDPEVLARVEAALERLSGLDAPDETHDPAELLQKGSDLDRAEQALAEGQREKARRIAERLLAKAAPDTLAHRSASYLLQRIDKPGVSRDTLAVLLPLSGRFGAAGEQMKQALEFGYKAGGGARRLLFLDSGSTPDSAVRALEEAVLDRGAIAAVGPLLSDETDAVVEAAEALRVPLFSLSRSLQDLEDLEWTLQAMMTPQDEVEALLDQVMTADGMRRFAIFAPENTYGLQATEAFREAVQARGGEITIIEHYDPEATDLLPHAQALGRKDYTERRAEIRQLRWLAEENNRDPSRVVLPPVLDFDALFLPDSYSRVPLACAALAYEEFPMGDFRPTRDSPTIPVLGLSGWNHHQIVGTGGPYIRRGYFTDALALPLQGPDPIWTAPRFITDFVEAYRAETGRTPTSLEAVVSDAGRLLAVASRSDADSRADFLDALMQARPSDTVTRVTGIDPETRRVARELWVLTVVSDGILPRAEMPEVGDY